MAELRRNALTGEWVSIVGNRQARPNLPTDGCPFCIGGLEAPEPYETLAFTNRWPAYSPGEVADLDSYPLDSRTPAPAPGAAEVVLYSPSHEGSLGSLGVAQIRKVVDLWAERTAALLARPEIAYALVFESRGEEVGATIHHPHGQIYAFPFVPPAATAELAPAIEPCRVCAEVDVELAEGDRVVFESEHWVGFVPFASEYPFGVRLTARAHVGRLDQLNEAQRDSLAEALEDVLQRYDRLWSDDSRRSEIFPYLMWFHQQDAAGDPRHHLHVHFAPPQRSPGVPRFVAAGEVGSGTLSNPVLPEQAAEVLRGCLP